jgi:hypothetical protein
MHKHVLSGVQCDEAKAFVGIEKLHCSKHAISPNGLRFTLCSSGRHRRASYRALDEDQFVFAVCADFGRYNTLSNLWLKGYRIWFT